MVPIQSREPIHIIKTILVTVSNTGLWQLYSEINQEVLLKRTVVKIGMKIATHLSTNISAYVLCARFIFSTGKNMAAPSELISQMVMYLHADSHVKPRRVKTSMQMRVGRKGHKKNKSQSVNCFGQELVRGEMEVSLKRQGEENYWIWKGGFG